MQKFNDWTVLEVLGSKAQCRCICGTERIVVFRDVRVGKSKGCGCVRRVNAALAAGKANKKHGMDGTREYRTWTDIKRRCHQPHRPDYKNYGARGIKVCDRWRFGEGDKSGFECFFEDMGKCPPEYTIDRRDNKGDYCKGNCLWVDRKTQERNKRTNNYITIFGQKITVIEAAEKYNIRPHTLYNRINTLKWDAERAVTQPIRGKKS